MKTRSKNESFVFCNLFLIFCLFAGCGFLFITFFCQSLIVWFLSVPAICSLTNLFSWVFFSLFSLFLCPVAVSFDPCVVFVLIPHLFIMSFITTSEMLPRKNVSTYYAHFKNHYRKKKRMTLGMARRELWAAYHPEMPPAEELLPHGRSWNIAPYGTDKTGVPLVNNPSGLGLGLNWGKGWDRMPKNQHSARSQRSARSQAAGEEPTGMVFPTGGLVKEEGVTARSSTGDYHMYQPAAYPIQSSDGFTITAVGSYATPKAQFVVQERGVTLPQISARR